MCMSFHISSSMHDALKLGTPAASPAPSPAQSRETADMYASRETDLRASTNQYSVRDSQVSNQYSVRDSQASNRNESVGGSRTSFESRGGGAREGGSSWASGGEGFHGSSDLGRATYDEGRTKRPPGGGRRPSVSANIERIVSFNADEDDDDSEFELSPKPKGVPPPVESSVDTFHSRGGVGESVDSLDEIQELDNIDTLTASLDEGSSWTHNRDSQSSPVPRARTKPTSTSQVESMSIQSIGSPADSDGDMVESFMNSSESPLPKGKPPIIPRGTPPSPGMSDMVDEELKSMDLGDEGFGAYKPSTRASAASSRAPASPGGQSHTSLELSDVEEIMA